MNICQELRIDGQTTSVGAQEVQFLLRTKALADDGCVAPDPFPTSTTMKPDPSRVLYAACISLLDCIFIDGHGDASFAVSYDLALLIHKQ